jgi:hypothetical protein
VLLKTYDKDIILKIKIFEGDSKCKGAGEMYFDILKALSRIL